MIEIARLVLFAVAAFYAILSVVQGVMKGEAMPAAALAVMYFVAGSLI
jgi:hydrogenase/urease accessory protein HupE